MTSVTSELRVAKALKKDFSANVGDAVLGHCLNAFYIWGPSGPCSVRKALRRARLTGHGGRGAFQQP